MKTIGLELSDAGILAAGGDPAVLLNLDGDAVESPGYAVPLKKQLLVGRPAEQQARMHPRQVMDQFWSLLSTDALQEKSLSVQNYAELAYAHLDHVRKQLNQPDAEWVLAVPDYLDPSRLGILLGIARELKVPVRGLVSNAVAAVQPVEGVDVLVHVDVHLHRTEVTTVKQDEYLTLEETRVITDLGWKRLLELWTKGLANAFVQSTRFDPFHEATAEQALYSKIPGLLEKLPARKPVPLELTTGETVYRIAVPADMLAIASAPQVKRVVECVGRMPGDCVQLSHRAARIPGLKEALQNEATVLDPGAGARGVLAMLEEFGTPDRGEGAAYLTRRKVWTPASLVKPKPAPVQIPNFAPTHILCGAEAYAIPLVIGSGPDADIKQKADGVAAQHCEVVADGEGVELRVRNAAAVLVDGQTVEQEIRLQAGQQIQVGAAPPMLAIRVLNPHGT